MNLKIGNLLRFGIIIYFFSIIPRQNYISGETEFSKKRSRTRIINRKESLQCSHCGRIFRFKYVRINHERTHTGHRPFGCLICRVNFSQSASLLNHYKSRKHKTITILYSSPSFVNITLNNFR
mmetsp:Transcript_15758/g.23732  ORF Transcript_15758/g.23732 Transcript_15758/m.23732 type:complete len:123 (+) Transcript_15758:2530-2898(+)